MEMGLDICRSVISAHGVTLVVLNREQGARMTVRGGLDAGGMPSSF